MKQIFRGVLMMSYVIQIAFLLSGLTLAQSVVPNQLTEDERHEGWRLLFDGKSTTGWEEITGKPFPSNCWTIDDSSLKALVRTDGFQDIRTHEVFGAFDLQFDWKVLKNGNSGLKYLVQRVDEWTNAAGRQARARGLEYQLADDANSDAASDPRRVAASLYSLIAPSPKSPPHIGEFNHSRIVVDGPHIQHWLNGVKVGLRDHCGRGSGAASRLSAQGLHGFEGLESDQPSKSWRGGLVPKH